MADLGGEHPDSSQLIRHIDTDSFMGKVASKTCKTWQTGWRVTACLGDLIALQGMGLALAGMVIAFLCMIVCHVLLHRKHFAVGQT